MKKQLTLILIKPDGVSRHLCGKIIKRFEQMGLTIAGMKFLVASEELARAHYPNDEKWYRTAGERTLSDYREKGIDPKTVFKSDEALEIGKVIKAWLVDYITKGPVLAFVIEGYEAVSLGRKITGNTIPLKANPGTIRGDFAHDNIELANEEMRPLYNTIHASGSVKEAEKEIALWFTEDELFSYNRPDEQFMFKSE